MRRQAIRAVVFGAIGLFCLSAGWADARDGHDGRGHHGGAHARGGHRDGRHFDGDRGRHFDRDHGRYYGGPRYYDHPYAGRIVIGGAFIAPRTDYYPPVAAAPYSYYTQQGDGYWYYCPQLGAYYPYVQQCPGPWQRVLPQ